jgi:hypothetical protein
VTPFRALRMISIYSMPIIWAALIVFR